MIWKSSALGIRAKSYYLDTKTNRIEQFISLETPAIVPTGDQKLQI
jgi:hypothetical protein